MDAKASARWHETMPKSLIPLAQAIRRRRENLGWSQEELAARCGFDRTYVSMLERGRRNPSFLNLLKLSDGLEISVSTLTEVYKYGPDAS